MKRWMRRSGNEAGEWSVVDLERDYRICAYNHEKHRGAHLHAPLDGSAGPAVPVSGPEEAERLVRRYAQEHEIYDLKRFRRMMLRWRSESKSD